MKGKKARSFHPASSSMTRRLFLAQSAGFASLALVPCHVLGAGGHTRPSEKLNIALVGLGARGCEDGLNLASESVVALCDVDASKRMRAQRQWPGARCYQDYRVMFDKQSDIDAVMVATPDHTHAIITMAAIKRGKHVFTQAPLTHTVFEAKALAAAAREHQVATQMGHVRSTTWMDQDVQKQLRDGAIGPVREVQVWTDHCTVVGDFKPPQDAGPVPADLDWDLFVGPASMRPYHRAYRDRAWRCCWDFGTGALGEVGCFALDPVFRALKLGYPTSVQAMSSRVNSETYPLASAVRYEFPARAEMPALTLTWYDGGLRPPRPLALDAKFKMGSEGVLYVGDQGLILKNATEDSQGPSPEPYQAWLKACKGGAPAASNFDWAGPLTEVVLMGNIALRPDVQAKLERQKLLWDSEKYAFKNLPEANAYLHKTYRTGWTL